MVAAGAVVTKNVKDHALMAGVPARQIGWVCECGQTNSGKFCSNCGKPRPSVKYCPNCGAKVAEGAKFCSDCGQKL